MEECLHVATWAGPRAPKQCSPAGHREHASTSVRGHTSLRRLDHLNINTPLHVRSNRLLSTRRNIGRPPRSEKMLPCARRSLHRTDHLNVNPSPHVQVAQLLCTRRNMGRSSRSEIGLTCSWAPRVCNAPVTSICVGHRTFNSGILYLLVARSW